MIIKVVGSSTQGVKIAKELLYKYVNGETVLFLSGGTTPKLLYKTLAKEKKLNPGAVALVDERYGLPFHLDSNERMIRDSGLLAYLKEKQVPFHSMLRLRPKGVASDFVRLLSDFPKRIAIMGVGEDGHTASLRAGNQKSKIKNQKYVVWITNFPGKFKERITLTFNALSRMDLLIVLVFGSVKQTALKLMFTQGLEEEIPARFYNRSEISKKTILITDQKV